MDVDEGFECRPGWVGGDVVAKKKKKKRKTTKQKSTELFELWSEVPYLSLMLCNHPSRTLGKLFSHISRTVTWLYLSGKIANPKLNVNSTNNFRLRLSRTKHNLIQ